MVQIYKDNRTGKRFLLEDMITMGDKVCLVPFDREDDKFVSPSTLKRWYTKWGTAQVVVEVKAFTGMKIGLFDGLIYDKEHITLWTASSKQLIFKREDWRAEEKQINAKNPKYASKIGRTFGYFLPQA